VTDVSISAQDYTDIMQLMSRYAWALDTGNIKAVGELFTPDGRMQDTAGKFHEGREAVVGYVRELTGTPAFRGRQHVIYNFLVDQSAPGRYQTRAYWSLIKWDDGTNEKRVDGTGYSEDIIVKIGGCWFFKERLVHRWSSTKGPWVG
jgi:hypothetical protein